MNYFAEKTAIVFPRIAGKDGPAKTLYKEDYFDPEFDPNNPLFNPARYGYSDEMVPMKADRKTMITLNSPQPAAMEQRTGQRFRSNFRSPDEATSKLIRLRRPV